MSNAQSCAEEANEKREEWADLLVVAIRTKDWEEIKAVVNEMRSWEFTE